MADENRITARYVRQSVSYDPKTGEFAWLNKIGPSGREAWPGSIFTRTSGQQYRKIGIHYQYYSAHRLAWLLMTGRWPKHEIDHINGDGLDNRWCNLREATHQQNTRNRKSRGSIEFIGRCWRIRIGDNQWISGFETRQKALKAYRKEILKRYGDFAHISFKL